MLSMLTASNRLRAFIGAVNETRGPGLRRARFYVLEYGGNKVVPPRRLGRPAAWKQLVPAERVVKWQGFGPRRGGGGSVRIWRTIGDGVGEISSVPVGKTLAAATGLLWAYCRLNIGVGRPLEARCPSFQGLFTADAMGLASRRTFATRSQFCSKVAGL